MDGTGLPALGITVSAIISEQSFLYDPVYEDAAATDWRLKHLRPVTRKEAYGADITYGVNSEFGFDYLRDNMVSMLHNFPNAISTLRLSMKWTQCSSMKHVLRTSFPPQPQSDA